MIFAQPILYQSSQATKVLIENVQRERLTTFVQEIRSLDEKYATESFSSLFLEEETWQLDDYTLLEVGPIDTNILASDSWVNKTFGWRSNSAESGNWIQKNYLEGTTDNKVNSNWYTINFNNSFFQKQILIASIAIYDGDDFAWLGSTTLSDAQVDIKTEEGISKDIQTAPIGESVNFLGKDGNNSRRGSKIAQKKEKQNNQGNLLFKSGFEGNVNVVQSKNGKYTISGTDSETSFSWDKDLPAEKAHFVYLTGKESPEPYIESRIEQVIGPKGDLTNALYMEVTKDYQEDNFVTRNEFSLFPSPDMKQGYISYSMKLQSNYWDAWPDKDAWRLFMEWKEPQVGDQGSTNNYRFNLSTRADRKQKVHWTGKVQQTQPSINTEWEADNKEVPVPIDEWFDIEVFWRKGDEDNGRLWLAINGKEVLDFQGRTEHASRPQDLKFWSIFKLYTGLNSLKNGPVYQWIDDVEIRSDTPRNLD